MIKEKIDNKTLIKILFGMFILIIITLISIVLKDTHAYYNYEMAPVPIFTGKVGNFVGDGESVKEGPLTDRNTDVNVIFYIQMPDNAKKYMISKNLPVTGYKVNNTASNCYPATGGDATYSNYSISSDGTLSLTYTEASKPTQVVCRIYYDRDKLSDVIIYAYLQDPNGERTYKDNKYKLINQVASNYTLVGSECKSKTSKTTFNYTVSTGFTITSSGPDTCYAYFKN